MQQENMMGLYQKQMRHQSKAGLERFKSKYPLSCFLLSSAQMPLWSLTYNGLSSFGKIALVHKHFVFYHHHHHHRCCCWDSLPPAAYQQSA